VAKERVPATPIRTLLTLPRGAHGLSDPQDLPEGRFNSRLPAARPRAGRNHRARRRALPSAAR